MTSQSPLAIQLEFGDSVSSASFGPPYPSVLALRQ